MVTQHATWFAADIIFSTININQDNVHEWAILDSGVTSHFLLTTAPTTNKNPALSPLHVTMRDGDQVQSTHPCDLDIPLLPSNACNRHIVPGLASHSLLSIVKLCNAGCDMTLTKTICVELSASTTKDDTN